MKQRAYTLLFILPVLLGMAAMLSAVVPVSYPATENLDALSDARQRLIAYSAAYVESYNPGSAGPGHLPCPDTDRSPDRYAVQSGLYGDGPNPPCGKHTIAIGKLPRHITHATHRYAFHLEDKHNIWYAVDTRFVNNPINRTVNPGTVGRIRWAGHTQLAAIVFTPDEASGIWTESAKVNTDWLRQTFEDGTNADQLRRVLKQSVVITPTALLSAVTPRVALWLQDQFSLSGSLCIAGRVCQQSLLAQCYLDVRTLLLLFLLDNANSANCRGTPEDKIHADNYIADSNLEGVLYQRHWFKRNDWWRFTEVDINEQCTDIMRCTIQVQSKGSRRPLLITVSAAK